MLDDLKMIHERDAQDALGLAEKQWSQLLHDYKLPKIEGNFDTVVYCGMGGSGLGAFLSQTWPGYGVPFEICRSYDLPRYVSKTTLCVVASYSGNTEEELSTLEQAESKGATIVVIEHGGKLAEIAREKRYPVVEIPAVSQPRYAALYLLSSVVQVMEAAGLVDSSKRKELAEAGVRLQTVLEKYGPTVPTEQNQAKQLALELMGSSIVVYASTLFAPVAYKWKISFNENAKNVAWWGVYPEFNHNEFLGWSSHPVDKPYKVIDLRSNLDHPQVQKRFVVSDRLLSGKRPAAHVVQFMGENVLDQMLAGMVLGDFVSLYLALLNGLNPTPVDLIEKLKKEL